MLRIFAFSQKTTKPNKRIIILHGKRKGMIDFSQINKTEKGPSFSSFTHLPYEPFPNRIHF